MAMELYIGGGEMHSALSMRWPDQVQVHRGGPGSLLDSEYSSLFVVVRKQRSILGAKTYATRKCSQTMPIATLLP